MHLFVIMSNFVIKRCGNVAITYYAFIEWVLLYVIYVQIYHKGSVTLPTCVDHDQRCSQSSFQSILCKSTNPDTKKFAIATCPKSCKLCQEYIGMYFLITRVMVLTSTFNNILAISS